MDPTFKVRAEENRRGRSYRIAMRDPKTRALHEIAVQLTCSCQEVGSAVLVDQVFEAMARRLEHMTAAAEEEQWEAGGPAPGLVPKKGQR